MKNMTDVLDSIVHELKAYVEFSDMRFIYAGKTSPAERPVTSYLVVCSVKSFGSERESETDTFFSGNLEFTVYSPRGTSKREVTQKCVALAQKLEDSSQRDMLRSIGCKEAYFDNDALVWCQSIVVKTEYVGFTQVKAQGFSVEAEGIGEFSAVEFEEICEQYVYGVKEYLSGTVSVFSDLPPRRSLRLMLKGTQGNLPEGEFDLYIRDTGRRYKGCRVTKCVTKVTFQKGTYKEFTLLFDSDEAVSEVTDE